MNHLERTFESTPQSVQEARGFVTFAVGCYVDTARTDDIRSCVSELASNAVLHTDASSGRYTVKICVDRHGCVRLEVHDYDHVQPEASAENSDRDSTNGRGLFIVEHLSDTWGVESSPRGKIVWSHFAGATQSGMHNACEAPPEDTPTAA
ncbi:ATP-binding protein [Streptomyces sp. 049-1]|uniref:ATP-binding protein n=1 Tax=Streptomyces sp. 049-1 TaxID=2789264 RepID=UPI003980CCB6